jgi:predicted ester cyclase
MNDQSSKEQITMQRNSLLVMCVLAVLIISAVVTPYPTSAQDGAEGSLRDTALTVVDQIYNYGNVTIISEKFAADYVRQPGAMDRVALMGNIMAFRAAMPDLHAVPELVIVEDNWVALRLRLQGNFAYELAFPDTLPIAPNGQPVEMMVNIIFHFNDQGQVVEEWDGFDNLNFLSRIGVIAPPAPILEPAVDNAGVSQPGMEEQNVGAVHQYFEALNQGNLQALAANIPATFVAHNPFGVLDQAGFVRDLDSLHNAMPDLNVSVDRLIKEGNWTAALHTMRGTFTGNFVMADGAVVPPTNRPFELLTVAFFCHDQQGAIVEMWELYDSWDFLTQLGLVLSSPAQGAA